jgi:hypothetical protein
MTTAHERSKPERQRSSRLDGTKLIVVDGLSGLGKSTTAQWLELQLRRRALDARWLWEADVPHPLHWWPHWDGTAYRAPDFERVAPQAFMAASLERWEAFVTQARQSDMVVVAEAALLQLGTGMLLQGDARPAELYTYAREVQRIAGRLRPLLIYFRHADVASHLRRICALRGPAFTGELIANMERTPYLRRRNLRGLDGLAPLWVETQAIADQVVAHTTLPTLTIETSAADWAGERQAICAWLGIAEIDDADIVLHTDLARYVGSYTWEADGEGAVWTVALDDGGLTLAGAGRAQTRLLPITAQAFYDGTVPFVVTFAYDPQTDSVTLLHDSTRAGAGCVQTWRRVSEARSDGGRA